jgi:hypothetical protein
MVQVPPAIAVKEKEHRGTEAATYMESVVNQMAQQGWEFYRVDSIGVQLKPGCLAGVQRQLFWPVSVNYSGRLALTLVE